MANLSNTIPNQACFCIPVDCDICYQIDVSYCPGVINIQAHITENSSPNFAYLWIRDKFSNIYVVQTEIFENGSFDINPADYPVGFFTQYAGSFDVFLTLDANGKIPIAMDFTSPASYCINLTVNPPVIFVAEDECTIFLSEDSTSYFIHE